MASGKPRTASATTRSKTSSRSGSTPDPPRSRGYFQSIKVEKGFGFIRCLESATTEDVGKDFFFHRSGLDGCAITDLQEGAEVTFERRDTPKGPRAESIRVTP